MADEQQQEIDELKAHVERLHAAFIPFMSKKQIAVDGVVMVPQITYNKWVEALSGKPAQSINHIKAQVEEETIERCAKQALAVNARILGKQIKCLPRKYSNQSETVVKDGE